MIDTLNSTLNQEALKFEYSLEGIKNMISQAQEEFPDKASIEHRMLEDTKEWLLEKI